MPLPATRHSYLHMNSSPAGGISFRPGKVIAGNGIRKEITMTRQSPKVPYDWDSRQPWLDLAFPVEEYQSRLKRVRAGMAARNLDALFVHGGPGDVASIRYLANFDVVAGDALVVVPREGDPILATTWVMHDEPMHTML